MSKFSAIGKFIKGFGKKGKMTEIGKFLEDPKVSEAKINAEFQKFKDTFDPGTFAKDIDIERIQGKDIEFRFKEKTTKLSELNELFTEGKFKEIFEKFDVDTNIPSVKDLIDRETLAVSKRKGNVEIKEIKEVETEFQNNKIEEPQGSTEDQLSEDLLRKSEKANMMAKTLKMLKKIIKNKGKKINIGKWVKRIAVISAAGGGAAILVKLAKQHQDAMNGCWLVDMNSGNKCKVQVLTCDEDAAIDPSSNKCRYCRDAKACLYPYFNPCYLTSTFKNKDNPMPGEYNPFGTETGACSNCSKCITEDLCTDEVCSPQCDCRIFKCGVGQKLECVRVDFWGALTDLIGDPISSIPKFMTILFYFFIGIVGVYILFFLISMFRKK